MSFDLTALDFAALGWLVAGWGGYTILTDHVLTGRVGLNANLKRLRAAWMRRMVERDNRITDSSLVGHTIHSVSFFASATMVIIAALLGAFGAVEHAVAVIGSVRFAATTTSAALQTKLLLLLAIFVYAFFKFTWALRQYNYACAMIGAAPAPTSDPRLIATFVGTTNEVLTRGLNGFNSGLRAYYFALAAIGWLVHPLISIGATTFMLAVLLLRQHRSGASRAILALADALERPTEPPG